jgi:hypothetical protein
MKALFWIAVITAILNVSSAAATELPIFELMGLPITPHQVAVVGAANVREQSPNPTLTFGGMPASPHQVAVLTPRLRTAEQASPAKLITIGLSAP